MDTLVATATSDVLTTRLAEMIAAGRLGAARSVLGAVRRMTLPSARVAELGAVLAMREGRLEIARAELDAAIADHPAHAGLRRCRAEVRYRLDDFTGTAADSAEAVLLDPANPHGKAILGMAMMELGRSADAVRCLAEAVANDPGNPSFREALAAAQAAGGDLAAAADTLAAAIAALPGALNLRNAAVLLANWRRNFAEAIVLADAAIHDGVTDACLFGLKGHALSSLERHEEAAEAYREALKLGPEDPYVRHLVSASGALPGNDRAPADYVRGVFNGYADRFDLHLISLGYRIPGLIHAALLGYGLFPEEGQLGPALDLGCGTGLVAVAVSDLPIGPFIGVDLSAKMLAQAAAKQLYAELHEADVFDFLAMNGPNYAIAFAADVLCYIGALDHFMVAVIRRLRPGGLFLLSAEAMSAAGPDRGWTLKRDGRYAHSALYIETAARQAGFDVVALEPEAVRDEANAPVPGWLAVLRRPHAG